MSSFEWGLAFLGCACIVALVLMEDPKRKLIAAFGAIGAIIGIILLGRPRIPERGTDPPDPLNPDPEPKHRETDAKIRELDEDATVYLDVSSDVDMAKLERLRAKLARRRRESLPDNDRGGDADTTGVR